MVTGMYAEIGIPNPQTSKNILVTKILSSEEKSSFLVYSDAEVR